jgi:NDP-sugar pyrophosphorylase family protein
MIDDAILLAGGLGDRLDTEIPKPVVKIKDNITIVEYQLNWLKEKGFKNIVLSTSHPVLKHLPEIPDVHIISGEVDAETAGRVKLGLTQTDGDWVYVMNCDDFIFGDYNPTQIPHDDTDLISLLVTHPRIGFSLVHGNGKVRNFERNPILKNINVMCGHYAINKELYNKIPKKGSIETLLMTHLATEGKIRLVPLSAKWMTVNNKKELNEMREFLCQIK